MRPSHPRLTRLARAGLGLTLATAVLAVLPAPATAAEGDTSPAASTRSQTDRAPQLRPNGLSTNGIASPVDVEGTPLFGWHVGSARQSAYRIVVASTPAGATAGEGDVWDSGTVSSDEQRGVPFAGPALATSERYFWAVQTWDGSGAPSGWSEPAQFGTGPGASWSGSAPVWAPSADRNWTDYTVEADVTVVQNAATLTFHATSTTAFNMWQLRADTDVLRTHQGTTLIEEVPLGFDLVEGETHRLRIETRGASVTTFVDDVPIRTTAAYTAHPSGGVGFRTGLTEQARFDDLSVVDSRGSVLYRNDFSAGAPELSSLSVADGELVVAAGRNDLVAGSWSAYELRARLRVDEVAAGLTFRADGAGNSYMWQFRGADNRLVPHRQTNGVYATLGSAVNLPTGTLAVGKTVEVRIRVLGSTYTTFIDGVQVDSRSDTSYRRGFIGVRNGNSEVATLDDLRVTDLLSGATLIEEDFDNGAAVFGCGSGSGGALTVGKGQACLQAGLTNDWAFLRGEVLLEDKEIAWASLFATGANARTAKQYVHKVYVNGSFVGLGPTQPIAGETRYDGFDVTGLLRSGTSNAVAALAYTTNMRKFQAELVVEYVDGARTVFGSGEDWTALNGERVFPEAGSIGVAAYFRAPKENLDARRFPFGFDEPGYDDSAWVPAAQTTPLGTLAATPTDKVEEQLHEAVSVEQRGPGHYVLDFGRTWIGGVSYDIASGTDGARVDLRFGEVRNADGSVRYNLATGNNYQDVVTLKDGPQTLETWGARVFRYVEVVGAPEAVTADTLRALALVYPFDPDASTFTASDDDLEQVYQLSKNSIESLNLNFYTDSWTRERTNYEADGYLQQMSTLYLMDDLSLARYSMDYFKNNRTWPTEWPLYVVLAVRDAWRQTGDLTQVRDYYANLVDKLPTEWVDPATGLVGKTFRSDGCNSQTDCDIVDWPAATERDGYRFRTFNTVVNALAYRAYRDMAELAGALGRTEDQTTWTGVAGRLRDAMNERLYDPATGSYDDGLDSSLVRSGHSALHASAFPLAFGVPEPGAQTAAVADHVSSLGMRCSVYCAAFVVKGLYDGGNGQAALDLLTATGTRSWMNMIALGAGSTMEAWDPSLKGNLTYSHPWAASPAFTVPAGLFGIQPASAGYDTVTVAPQPGDLEWGTIVTPTVKGSIGAAFDRTSTGELRVVASVPGNTRATVSVPTSATTATTLYVDGQPRTLTPVDGRLVVRNLSLGCHLLSPEESTDLGDHLATVCDRPLAQGATVVSQVDPVGDDGWSGAGSTLTLTLSGSTDAVVEYRLPGGEWSVYDGPVDLPAGSYEVATRARDAEGVIVTSATTPVRVDPVAPSVTATLDGRTVTATATDADSGVALVEHSLDGGDWTAHTAPLVLDDAAHSVEVRATDVAGNVSPIRRLDVPAGGERPPWWLTARGHDRSGARGTALGMVLRTGDGHPRRLGRLGLPDARAGTRRRAVDPLPRAGRRRRGG